MELIEALIAGLDESDPEPLDEAWIKEIERRSTDFDTGRVKPVPWSEVRDRSRAGETCRDAYGFHFFRAMMMLM